MPVVNLPLYRRPVVPPADIPNAYYGVGSSFAKTHTAITAALPERLTIITDQTINLEVTDGDYGWFYIRAEIENVRFMDLSVSLYGGWDGASWPEDGETVGETSGPITITDGEGKDWHLFRTDFPAIGNRVFRVSFTQPEEPETPTEPENPQPSVPTTPIYGVGVLDQPYTESAVLALLTNTHPASTGQTLNINITADNFGYFAIPLAGAPQNFSAATFIDQSNGFPGGWDGASWPNDGEIGMQNGPVVITIGGNSWNLYRTDFSSVGNKSFTVNLTTA